MGLSTTKKPITPWKGSWAMQQGLEHVFSEGHRHHNRIFYDPHEGQYYDKHTDLYLTLNQARIYGIK